MRERVILPAEGDDTSILVFSKRILLFGCIALLTSSRPPPSLEEEGNGEIPVA